MGALILGVLCFPALSSAATVTYASNKVMGPTNGLVGYWTMNAQDINWTTNTILDRSGYGNNGILTNMATKTSPVAGKLGQGLKFLPSPTVDYVRVPPSSSLDNLGPMTVSTWVYTNQTSGSVRIIQKSFSPIDQFGWYVHLNLSTGIGFSAGSSVSDLAASSVSVNLSKGWHHIAITWDGGINYSGVIFYVDGSAIGTNTGGSSNGSGTRGDDSGQPLTLGGYLTQTTNYHLNGSLDDVRIYNRILTPSEVTQVYKAGQVQLASTPKKNASGLVGWWTFDGKDVNWTTGTALDRSGLGNNGTLNGTTKPKAVTGKLGQGMKFNPNISSQNVDASSPASLDNLNTMTISAWVNPASSVGTGYILSKTLSLALTDGWQFTKSGASLYFQNAFSTSWGMWTFIAPLKVNQWTHVVLTYDRTSTSNVPTLYVNASSTPVFPLVSPSGTTLSDDSASLNIGGVTGFTNSFNGSLDDVRIYNRILSATEVKQLYKEGQVAVTSFTCGVSTVKDVDGNVYNTVKIGTQCWMKQNMRVGTRINVATAQSNNSIIEKYCYDDTSSNCTSNHPNQPDGGLYQWNEAMQYSTTPGARGICPAGWHIPTHDQWTTLERAVCTSGSCATDFPYDTSTFGFRGTNEGTKLKADGTSGFEGNLAGNGSGGSFSFRGSYGYFWSSVGSGSFAWRRYLSSGNAQVYRGQNGQSNGYSVRCLQN